MKNLLKFAKDESGATAIEYGLLAALISIVGITAFTFAGTQVEAAFDRAGGSIENALAEGEGEEG